MQKRWVKWLAVVAGTLLAFPLVAYALGYWVLNYHAAISHEWSTFLWTLIVSVAIGAALVARAVWRKLERGWTGGAQARVRRYLTCPRHHVWR